MFLSVVSVLHILRSNQINSESVVKSFILLRKDVDVIITKFAYKYSSITCCLLALKKKKTYLAFSKGAMHLLERSSRIYRIYYIDYNYIAGAFPKI